MQDTRSLWEKTVSLPAREALHGDIHTQVAILGAGMTGCLLGYRLKELGVDCVLLEAGTVGSGQTGHTTAKVTAQHGMLTKLVQKVGMERARLYVAANQLAGKEYAALAARLDRDVGYSQCPSYLYAQPGGTMLRQEANLEADLGLPAVFTTDTDLPFPIQGAVRLDSQAVFHPLAFLQAITGGLPIYEHTQAVRVRGHRIWTPHGTVTAKQIVFACHYPFRNVPGFYFLKLHQARDYVLGLENVAPLSGSYYGVDQGDLSLRPAEGLVLVGGCGHRSGHNAEGSRYEILAQRAAVYFPRSRVVVRWSAQDCMTPDGLPYVGPYSVFRPDWYVATGFNQWGMTNAMAAAMILSDLLCGRKTASPPPFPPAALTPLRSMASWPRRWLLRRTWDGSGSCGPGRRPNVSFRATAAWCSREAGRSEPARTRTGRCKPSEPGAPTWAASWNGTRTSRPGTAPATAPGSAPTAPASAAPPNRTQNSCEQEILLKKGNWDLTMGCIAHVGRGKVNCPKGKRGRSGPRPDAPFGS